MIIKNSAISVVAGAIYMHSLAPSRCYYIIYWRNKALTVIYEWTLAFWKIFRDFGVKWWFLVKLKFNITTEKKKKIGKECTNLTAGKNPVALPDTITIHNTCVWGAKKYHPQSQIYTNGSKWSMEGVNLTVQEIKAVLHWDKLTTHL